MARLRDLCALAACSALCLSAQQAPPSVPASDQSTPPASAPARPLISRSPEERERAYRAQHRIVLNLVVTDASGKPVTGLKPEDFAVLDNSQPRKIASFQAVEHGTAVEPVRVVLMMDTLNNPSGSIAHQRKDLEKFLVQNQGRLTHPTAIGLLAVAGASVGQFSQDGNLLIGELKSVTRDTHTLSCNEEANSASAEDSQAQSSVVTDDVTGAKRTENLLTRLGNCENRRFQASIAALNKFAKQQVSVPGRVLLLWIGPGWSLLTGPQFRPNTPPMRRSFYDYLADLSTSLREAQVTLDAIATPDMVRSAGIHRQDYDIFLNSAPADGAADAGNLSLPVLARQSGGQVLLDSKDIGADIGLCIAAVDSYYVLSFDTPPAAQTGEYHSLEVKPNNPALTVRTNTAYFAQP